MDEDRIAGAAKQAVGSVRDAVREIVGTKK
jgi:uncharacterized protein YjbJ (UPF0337 family)